MKKEWDIMQILSLGLNINDRGMIGIFYLKIGVFVKKIWFQSLNGRTEHWLIPLIFILYFYGPMTA